MYVLRCLYTSVFEDMACSRGNIDERLQKTFATKAFDWSPPTVALQLHVAGCAAWDGSARGIGRPGYAQGMPGHLSCDRREATQKQ